MLKLKKKIKDLSLILVLMLRNQKKFIFVLVLVKNVSILQRKDWFVTKYDVFLKEVRKKLKLKKRVILIKLRIYGVNWKTN